MNVFSNLHAIFVYENTEILMVMKLFYSADRLVSGVDRIRTLTAIYGARSIEKEI